MPTPNISPIFSRAGSLSSNNGTAMAPTLTAAAADYTGVHANNKLVFTADPYNGGFIQRLRFKAIGTNVVAVARIYINNGQDPAVATNNSFYDEVNLPATVVSTTAPTTPIDHPLNFALEPGFRIYVGLGALVAAGWVVTPVAGRY